MSFQDPWWLMAIPLIAAALLWSWHRHDVRQEAALGRFVAPHLREPLTRSVSVTRRRLQRGLLLGAIVCLAVALAGPLMGYRWELIERRGHEFVFAIDTSRSMLTADVRPNRLTRAKLAVAEFGARLAGDAVGIVAFAGTAFQVCPITLDYRAFEESLAALDTRTIPRGGTNIAAAIAEAARALGRSPRTDRTLILITDGEDLEGDAVQAARMVAQQADLIIYTVGVGTASGERIELPLDQGGGYVTDETGAPVTSRLDEAKLTAIAAATGGFYVPLGATGEGLEQIRTTVLSASDAQGEAFRQRRVPIERYQWPLAAAVALLMASLMTGVGRRARAWRMASAGVVSVVALVFCGAWPNPLLRAQASGTAPAGTPSAGAPAAGAPNTGAPNTGAAGDATKPASEFNSGTAAYRAGRFPQAMQSFEQSIKRAPSSDLQRLRDQQDAYYNLGDALYRAGQKSEQSAPQEALRLWTEAVKAYDTALQLRRDDADAKYNRDFVQRKIDALRQQQNQPPQSQPNSQSKSPQPPQPKGGGANKPPPGQGGGQPPAPQGSAPAEASRSPGQMSRDEATQLLDAAKSDERSAQAAPLVGTQASGPPPDKPFKNW